MIEELYKALYKAITDVDLNKVKDMVNEYGVAILNIYDGSFALNIAALKFSERIDNNDNIDKMLDIIQYLFEQNKESINYQTGSDYTPFVQLLNGISGLDENLITPKMINLLIKFIDNGAEYVKDFWGSDLQECVNSIGNIELINRFNDAYQHLAGGQNYYDTEFYLDLPGPTTS